MTCPRWASCNASFCPAAGGMHLRAEPVCLYLREAVKRDGEACVRHTLPRGLAEVVLATASEVLRGTDRLAAALRRASNSPSKVRLGHQRAANIARVAP